MGIVELRLDNLESKIKQLEAERDEWVVEVGRKFAENQKLREELKEVVKIEEIMKTLDDDQVWSLIHSVVLSVQKALEEQMGEPNYKKGGLMPNKYLIEKWDKVLGRYMSVEDDAQY
jgi:hypothetical protein